jgi:DNA-binding GntR family transcriptional regulator
VRDHRSILKYIKKKTVLESVELMGRHLMSMESRLPSSTGKRANVEQTKSTIPATIKNEKRT